LIAYIENGVANIAMIERDTDEARRRWLRSEEIYARIGSPQATIPMMNVATIDLANGDFAAARERLRTGLRRFVELDWQIYVGVAHIELLSCAAHFGAWDDWDEHLTAGAAVLAERGVVDEEIAASAERAGLMALDRLEFGRGRVALELAAAQWRGVGEDSLASAALSALPAES
jgi:hypothetical protein